MKCPKCGHADAYLGLDGVDCLNTDCEYFKQVILAEEDSEEELQEVAEEGEEEEEEEDLLSILIDDADDDDYEDDEEEEDEDDDDLADLFDTLSPSPTSVITKPKLQLWVKILKKAPKTNSVEITIQAGGDPGNPNKIVEVYWYLPNSLNKQICTLSSPNIYHLSGIDADGVSTYTTHWMCQNDGVQPTANFKLDATIR